MAMTCFTAYIPLFRPWRFDETMNSMHAALLHGEGEIDHGLGDGERAFGAAEPLLYVPGLERQGQRARVGVADVLIRHAHHAARDVERIGTAVEHAREPVPGSC